MVFAKEMIQYMKDEYGVEPTYAVQAVKKKLTLDLT